jgi:quercetin dioxygenase-like cupin family protein
MDQQMETVSATGTLKYWCFIFTRRIKMKKVEAREAEAAPNPHGVHTSKVYDHENAQVVYMVLEPGQALKKHITPVDVFFYVLEGKVVVEIGDERQEVEQDTLVESPASIPHLLANQSEGISRVLVVKAPRPTESTKIL